MVVEGLRFAPDRSGVRVPAVMEEFANILQRDYGLKPQGKAAPMTAVRGAGGLGALGVLGVGGTTSSGENGSSRRDAVAARRNGTVPGRGSVLETGADEYGEDGLFASVGVRRSNNNSNINSDDPFGLATGSTGYGDVFGGPPSTKYGSSKYSSMSGPEDIFRVGSKSQAGVSKSSNLPVYDKPVYDDDFFGGVPGIRAPATAPTTTTAFDDVFGGAGPAAAAASSSAVAVDDLLGGFPAAEERKPKTAGPSARAGSRGGPGSLHSARSLGRDTTIFDDLLSGESSRPSRKASSRTSNRAEKQFSSADPSQEQSSYVDPIISIMQQNSSSVRLGSDAVEGSSDNVGSSDRPGLDGSDDFSPPPYVTGKSSWPGRGGRRKDTPSDSSALRREGSGVPQQFGNDMEQPAVSVETARSESPTEDKWVTVEDVKLVTPPSTLPPPARPVPLVGEDRSGASPQHGVRSNRGEQSRLVTGKESDARTASQRQPASSFWGVGAAAEAVAAAAASGVDGLEEFISGVLSKSGGSSPPEEGVRSDVEGPGAQAAMKEAMERAEVKLRVAKEARARDREEKQREAMIARAIAREKEEREAREEKEREKLRKEREKEREMEREKDRAAERAAERAAAERAAAEARERAERAAVERAAAEARERAAAKAAAERAAAERAAAERAATERAAAEARERAERAAAERAKDQQRRSDSDFDRLFSTRPTSEPRRPVDPEQTSDQRSSQTFGVDAQQRRASASTAGMRRVSSTTNIDNDWTSLFSSPSQEEFQEIEGETADRRKARWERHQRTTERATKALQEKKQRELDLQREQAEKHRAGEVLDTEIKRWAAGKEGNLRALLSSLQYVLWPECGWQAVSLTDLITPQAVKKAYRKATLCVHPDKVQQKGATVQQKYIAEKVFDLLKESWNKFNSEELF